MSFGLQFDGGNDLVTFETWTATGDFSISMTFVHTVGLEIFLGSEDVVNFVASRNSTEVRVRIGGAQVNISGFVVGNTYSGILSRTGSTVTLNLNDSEIDFSWTNSNTFVLDGFGVTSFFYSDILSETWTMTGSGNQRDYNFNQQTGSVLPELSDNKTGTLVNFPTDDSQWVDLGGGISVTVTGIPSSEAFGTTLIILDESFISPSSITSLEEFGGATIVTGVVMLLPTAIPSQEALGNPELVYPQIVVVSGIGSEEVFGIAIIQDGIELVIPVGDRDTYQRIGKFLDGTGRFVSTQNNDIIVEWLKSEGIDAKQFNDLFFKYWTGQGFTGAYNDKWKQWKDS